MGCRATITFKKLMRNEKGGIQPHYSPSVYLHWDGWRVERLLQEAAPNMRKGDLAYACARFIGHCASKIDGPLSLGVFNSGNGKSLNMGSADQGDAGVFIVDVDTGEVENMTVPMKDKLVLVLARC